MRILKLQSCLLAFILLLGSSVLTTFAMDTLPFEAGSLKAVESIFKGLNLSFRDEDPPWSTLDCSFGRNGIAKDNSSDETFRPMDIAVQRDGRILVTGFFENPAGSHRAFLRRYMPNGTPDPRFGTNGSVRLRSAHLLTHERGERIALLPNGKIAVYGLLEGSGQIVPVVWMINGAGTADDTFGTNGVRTLSEYPGYDRGDIMSVRGNRVLVVVSSRTDAKLVGLRPNGSLDPSFGTNGEVTTGLVTTGELGVLVPRSNSSPVRAYIESTTGNIVVAGRVLGIGDTGFPRNRAIQLRRFLPNGTADNTFHNYQIGPDCPPGASVECPTSTARFNSFYRITPVEVPGGGVLIHYSTFKDIGIGFQAFNVVDANGLPVIEWQPIGLPEIRLNFAAIENSGDRVILGKVVGGLHFRSYTEASTGPQHSDSSFVIPFSFGSIGAFLTSYDSRPAALLPDNRVVAVGILDDRLTLAMVLP